MPDYQVVGQPETVMDAVCSRCGHPLETEDEPLGAQSTPVTAPVAAPPGRFAAGALLADRYRIVEMLGSGGAGEVYRAQDLTLNQPVALKLFSHLENDHSSAERFHREVRLARQISHGNVCRVFDIGEATGHPFITMEFVSGEDLHRLLHRIGRLSAGKALQVSRQLCAGVAAAHEAGVLHRDLKPANIMLDARGNVRITDFGLAILAADPHELHAGTPGYMSPEQLAGQEVTARSDIYALGLVLHELFTGRRAVEPRNASELMRVATRRSQILPMPGVHPLVQQVIARCLDSNPARRPASALHIAAVLSRVARMGSAVESQRPLGQSAVLPQDSLFLRFAWTLLGTSLAGAILILMLAPVSTGVGLSFTGPDGSISRVFSWLWCIALQLLMVLAAITFVLKKHSQREPPSPAENPVYPVTLQ